MVEGCGQGPSTARLAGHRLYQPRQRGVCVHAGKRAGS